MAQRSTYLGAKELDTAAIAALPEALPTNDPRGNNEEAGQWDITNREDPPGDAFDELLLSVDFTAGTAPDCDVVVAFYFPDGGWEPSAAMKIYSYDKIKAAIADRIGGLARLDCPSGATHAAVLVLAAAGGPTDLAVRLRGQNTVEER